MGWSSKCFPPLLPTSTKAVAAKSLAAVQLLLDFRADPFRRPDEGFGLARFGEFLGGLPLETKTRWPFQGLYKWPPFGESFQVTLKKLEVECNIQHHMGFVNWVVVSNIFYFHPYLGKISNLTNIFQMGWNHQLEVQVPFFRATGLLFLRVSSWWNVNVATGFPGGA